MGDPTDDETAGSGGHDDGRRNDVALFMVVKVK